MNCSCPTSSKMLICNFGQHQQSDEIIATLMNHLAMPLIGNHVWTGISCLYQCLSKQKAALTLPYYLRDWLLSRYTHNRCHHYALFAALNTTSITVDCHIWMQRCHPVLKSRLIKVPYNWSGISSSNFRISVRCCSTDMRFADECFPHLCCLVVSFCLK